MCLHDAVVPFFVYRSTQPVGFQLVTPDIVVNRYGQKHTSRKLRVAKEIPWNTSATWRLSWVPTMGASEPKLHSVFPTVDNHITCLTLVNTEDSKQRFRVCVPSKPDGFGYGWVLPPRGAMEVAIYPTWVDVDGKYLRSRASPSLLKHYITSSDNNRKIFTHKDLLARVEHAQPAPSSVSETKTEYTLADAYLTLSAKDKEAALDGTTNMMWGIEECRRLMDFYGLKSWRLRVSSHLIRTAGTCWHYRKFPTISLSSHMLKSKIVKRSEILDTILHEIAHALVGHKEAHGPVWVAKAKEIGCSGCPTHSMRFHPATLRPRKRKDMPKKTEDIPASEYEDEDLSELRRFMREFPEEFEDDDYDY